MTIEYVTYDPALAADRLGSSPRFGNPREFSLLFSDNTDDDEKREQYIRGLLAGGIITIAVFVAWSCVICIWMLGGRKKFGFLSGRPFLQVIESQESNGAINDSGLFTRNTLKKFSSDKRPARVRVAFIIAGLLFIVFAILLVAKGLTNLQNSVNIFHGSAEDVNTITIGAKDVIQNGFRQLKDEVDSARTQVTQQLFQSSFCPADPSVQNSDLAQQVKTQAEEAVVLLDQLNNFSDEPLNQLENAIEKVQNAVTNIGDYTDQIELTDWKVLLILIPYTTVPAILIACCIMVHLNVDISSLRCSINWLFLPLFVIMTAAAWGSAAGMLMGANATSDFCLPGGEENMPGTTIQNIMVRQGFNSSSIVYDSVSYYIGQCQNGTDPLDPVRRYDIVLKDSLQSINQLSSYLDDQSIIAEMSLYCNKDFGTISVVVKSMKDILTSLMNSANRTLGLLSCERIVPIYVTSVYEGACRYSPKGMAWIFSCSLLLGIFGMILITLRAAFKMIEFEESENQIKAGSERDEAPREELSHDLCLTDSLSHRGLLQTQSH